MTQRIDRNWPYWALWLLVLGAATYLLVLFGPQLDKAHVALVYLLVVLGGTATAGRTLGLVLAGGGFVLFNWLFLPPYHTLAISNPLDWLVLLAFLIVSGVVAQLLHRLRKEAEAAEARATEVDRLAQLGAGTLKVARAEEAFATIAEMIRAALGLSWCKIHRLEPGSSDGDADPLVTWAAEHGHVAVRQVDDTVRLTDSPLLPTERIGDARRLFMPLSVHERRVGVLELGSDGPIALLPTHRRYVAALGYYAALAVERARLESQADHVEALREADRLKSALLASVSHDLRTPLTTIKAIAHDLSSVDDRALIIEEEANRLNRVVGDLLDLSRLQAGAMPVAPEINAVDELVGALLQRISGLLGDRPLQVELAEGGTLLIGRFDLVQSLRILANLVENAHKYSPAGAPIELAVKQFGDWIEFDVRDHGPGVPEAERERIFEPFHRTPSAAPDVAGSGLGLAIARQLARAQGGDVTYRPHPTGGSRFRLTLPSAELPQAD